MSKRAASWPYPWPIGSVETMPSQCPLTRSNPGSTGEGQIVADNPDARTSAVLRDVIVNGPKFDRDWVMSKSLRFKDSDSHRSDPGGGL